MKPRINSKEEEGEDMEALLPTSGYSWHHKPSVVTTRNTLLALFTILISVTIGYVLGEAWPRNTDAVCTAQLSRDSPVLRGVDIKYNTVRFNGSFMHENIYRRPGSPEVDAAWEALGVNYKPIAVPAEQARLAGLRPDHVQINPKYGGGYPANIEGLHHLHCLNLLRQGLWYNYEYYQKLGKGAFENKEHIVQKHMSHCLDIIRQQLMCSVDVAVFGQIWYDKKEPTPFVDFNTDHKCRNYEAIRKWAEPRQLPENQPDDFLLPPTGPDQVLAEMP